MTRQPATRLDPEADTAPEQRSIQSVVIGFRLIEALEAAPGPLSLKELAAAAGMPPSRAHAYLASLRAVGLVAQDGEGGRYDLGPRALSLGLAALGRLEVRDAALPAMRRFRDGTGEAVHLSVWAGQAPVIVSRLDGTRGGSLSIRIGTMLPLERSASGRIFLAFLDEADAGARERLGETVDRVRADRMAMTDGLLNAGFAAISVPVFDHLGEIAGAMTTLGAAGHLDTSPDGPAAEALRAAGESASAALGYQPESNAEPEGR
ncbi:IclR family transcriptional regulator [Roseomonas populi]|uniref:IclR family transcriptional regulator n=1 Tax=Roseomonas populi TaxID=3121582 RepID=A0ABT1WZ79_9PROT|nr:IclR family transcriptional regulator [Roseomonas pecuniae]MCR0981148.1 IclR family transcriptional regulator [Roseomonas pecuniae]